MENQFVNLGSLPALPLDLNLTDAGGIGKIARDSE